MPRRSGDYGAVSSRSSRRVATSCATPGPCSTPAQGHIFINANRNKRSVVLDLKKPDDRANLLKLCCATADVLAYNIRPASMARTGLSWEAVQAVAAHRLLRRLWL